MKKTRTQTKENTRRQNQSRINIIPIS